MRLNMSLIGWDDAFLKDDGSFMKLENIGMNRDARNINDDDDDDIKYKAGDGKDAMSSKQDIVAQYYYNIWEQGLASKPYVMANRGMKVGHVMTMNFLFNILTNLCISNNTVDAIMTLTLCTCSLANY